MIDLRSKKIAGSLPPNKIVATNDKSLTPEKKAALEKQFMELSDEPVTVKQAATDLQLDETLVQALDPGVIALMTAERKGLTKVKSETPTSEPKKVEPALPTAGGTEPQSNCPNCGHQMSKTDVPEVTRDDKLSFLVSVLGQQRWKKEYSLLNGELIATFRTLTTAEADLAFTQAAFDAQNGKIVEEGQYLRTLMDYRLAMSLESLKLKGKTVRVPEMYSDDWKVDVPPKGSTRLTFILPWFYDNVLTTEQLRRMIGSTMFRFQRLTEKLEARIDDEDFWKATEEHS